MREPYPYSFYRSVGHSPLVAFTLSAHPVLWYGAWAFAGVVLGMAVPL